jgi:Transposase IS4
METCRLVQFHKHQARMLIPSEHICADESISRWYGQGDKWSNHGLPMYVAIDQKPEHGCGIQNSASAKSAVITRMKLVKRTEEERTHVQEGGNRLLHGTKVLKYLISSWNFSHRMVCADSYFASAGAAIELTQQGFSIFEVGKTATTAILWHHPMAYLSHLEMHERGEINVIIKRDNNGYPNQLAFVWMS